MREHDVERLEVAVHDAALLEVVHGRGDFVCEPHGVEGAHEVLLALRPRGGRAVPAAATPVLRERAADGRGGRGGAAAGRAVEPVGHAPPVQALQRVEEVAFVAELHHDAQLGRVDVHAVAAHDVRVLERAADAGFALEVADVGLGQLGLR